MNTINMQLLKETSDITRHIGNYVFAIKADIANVYEVVTYENYEPVLLKDLQKSYLVTKSTTWDKLYDKFFGTPQQPNFIKVLKV